MTGQNIDVSSLLTFEDRKGHGPSALLKFNGGYDVKIVEAVYGKDEKYGGYFDFLLKVTEEGDEKDAVLRYRAWVEGMTRGDNPQPKFKLEIGNALRSAGYTIDDVKKLGAANQLSEDRIGALFTDRTATVQVEAQQAKGDSSAVLSKVNRFLNTEEKAQLVKASRWKVKYSMDKVLATGGATGGAGSTTTNGATPPPSAAAVAAAAAAADSLLVGIGAKAS